MASAERSKHSDCFNSSRWGPVITTIAILAAPHACLIHNIYIYQNSGEEARGETWGHSPWPSYHTASQSQYGAYTGLLLCLAIRALFINVLGGSTFTSFPSFKGIIRILSPSVTLEFGCLATSLVKKYHIVCEQLVLPSLVETFQQSLHSFFTYFQVATQE